MDFLTKLRSSSRKNNSLLCIGLDTDLDKIPKFFLDRPDPIVAFNRAIVEATKDLVCAYKPNAAFYEVHGTEGWVSLETTLKSIPDSIPIILDAKRGDIGNTAAMYAKSAFENLNVDAVTVNPYLGFDSVEPFLRYKEKCSFVLCLTSNPGAKDFQNLIVDGQPVYQRVARKVVEWNKVGLCGLVVGATRPEELREIREIAPDVPFLIPGIGTQGGDLEAAVKFGTDKNGEMAVINVSRAVIYASSGNDFAEKARQAALEIRGQINAAK